MKNHDSDMGMKIGVSRGAAKFIFAKSTHYGSCTYELVGVRKNAESDICARKKMPGSMKSLTAFV